MDATQFLITFLLMIMVGTLIVTGWYFITRGEEKLMEDGTTKRTGKVFRGWYFFWTKKKLVPKKVYLNDAFLYELYMKIKPKFNIRNNMSALSIDGDTLKIENAPNYDEEMHFIEKAFEVKFENLRESNLFAVYKEYDDFVFPYWVRDPLAVCATCFSSVYGSMVYWIFICLVKINLFTWSSMPLLASILFWIGFCFALSVTNTALAKRFN